MIKMLVDSGANQQQRDNNTNAALKFSKKILARDTETLQKTQKKVDRLQKIVDLLEGKQPTNTEPKLVGQDRRTWSPTPLTK